MTLEFQTVQRYTGEEFTTIYGDYIEEPIQVFDTSPNYEEIKRKLKYYDDNKAWFSNNDESDLSEEIAELADLSIAVSNEFEKVTERVSVKNSLVYFDGDPVDDAITKQLVRYISEKPESVEPLALFMEKVYQNPSERSREQLYPFLDKHNFAIADDGDFIAYKGVTEDFLSVHSGGAIVDGKEVTGQVPNKVGSVIEVARSKVDDNPDAACSYGLHVANHRYANGWSTKLLEVKVNPRDVVSVPRDSNHEKVRVCRYTVVKESDGNELTTARYAQGGLIPGDTNIHIHAGESTFDPGVIDTTARAWWE